MRHITPLGLALAATLAVSGAASVSAGATEGPFWNLGLHGRLEAGETNSMTAAADEKFLLLNSSAKVTIECSSVKLQTGATINGSSTKTSSTAHTGYDFSSCVGGGKENKTNTCKPEGGTITTEPLVGTLGYSNSTRLGPLLLLVGPQTGNVLASIKFTGTECFASTTTLLGLVGALVLRSPNTPTNVGEELLSIKSIWAFLGAANPTVLEETNGTLKSIKPTLTAYGSTSTLSGATTSELTGNERWGAFTKAPQFRVTNMQNGVKVKVGETVLFQIKNETGLAGARVREINPISSRGFDWNLEEALECRNMIYGIGGKCEVSVTYEKKEPGVNTATLVVEDVAQGVDASTVVGE